MGAWATLVQFCLSKNGTLTFAIATLLESHSAMPWAVRRLRQTLVTVSPLTNTTTFSFDD